MSLRFQIRLRQAFECSVCLQIIEPEEVEEIEIIVKIFGAAPYAQCICGMRVDDGPMYFDESYRRRWRVAAFTRCGFIVRTSAGV